VANLTIKTFANDTHQILIHNPSIITLCQFNTFLNQIFRL